MSQDLSRLKSNLANGKMREMDFPTYQVINALINEIAQLKKELEVKITVAEESAGGLESSEFLTSSDESATLVNSRELKAGARIAFDDSVANERTVSASAINQLTGDVTAGPASGSTAATIANDAVTFAKMQNIDTDRILGRGDAGSGNIQELFLGTGLQIIGQDTLTGTPDRQWSVLTNGDPVTPELIFVDGDVIMVSIP